MFPDFPVLFVDVILRRTLVSCIALAVLAVPASFLLGQWEAGAGVVLGLGGATLNHRLFQVSTVRHIDSEGHLDRRPYAGSVAARLGALTAVAFLLLFVVRPMGFGMIGGLVAFQVLLMLNALGSLWSYHKRELATLGSSPVATRGVAPKGPAGGAGGPGSAGPAAQRLPGTGKEADA